MASILNKISISKYYYSFFSNLNGMDAVVLKELTIRESKIPMKEIILKKKV